MISIFILAGGYLRAQNQAANWVFGDSALLSFSDLTISADTVNFVIAQEASASISDTSGNLLFYTDGKYVWNRNQELMPNGCCLDIDQYWDEASSVTQGAIILPRSGYNNQYYIFLLSIEGISYNIIDMNLDGGMGDISVKNQVVIIDTLTEKMTAVQHGNGRDWWLIVHKDGVTDSTDLFYKVLITPDGVTVFTQNTGVKRDGPNQGQMVFSPEGDKIALADKQGLEILDFDRCLGVLTPHFFIPIDSISSEMLYGCSFSPDGTKLYVSSLGTGDFSKIYQYCFNCNEPFLESKKNVFELVVEMPFFPLFCIGQLTPGPDGKIYFVISYTEGPNPGFCSYNMNLSTIEYPNEEGIACTIDTNSVYLNGRRTILGLPNFPNYILGPLTGSECDTIVVGINIEEINNFNVYPNPTNGFVYFDVENNYDQFHLTITNLLGTIIIDEEINNLSSTQFSVDLSDYGTGVYLYKLSLNDGKIFIGKVLKY